MEDFEIKVPGVSSGFSIFAAMRNFKIAVFILVLAATQQAAAQRLTIYKTFGSVIFMLNDTTELSMKQAGTLIYQNQQAYEEFKKARTRATISSVMGFTGAAMIAVPVATAAFGGDGDWALAGGGAVLVVGSVFFNRWFKARAVYAVDLYNASLQQKTSRIKPEFYFYGTGAKLVLKF
jgi:hypothetical protein